MGVTSGPSPADKFLTIILEKVVFETIRKGKSDYWINVKALNTNFIFVIFSNVIMLKL